LNRRGTLTDGEREVIAAELARGVLSHRAIGRKLGRHHSVVDREVVRNRSAHGDYRPIVAARMAAGRRGRPKPRKLVVNERLHDAVNEGLANEWSPEQISAKLVELYPDEPEMRVSHETVYQTLFLQARGELRTQLKLALRTGRTKRVSPSRAAQTRGRIVGMVNISERPKEADDRAVPGFWEGDLLLGKGNKSQIATLVERSTRFVMLVRIPYDRTAERVAYLLAKKMETLPDFLKNSLTWDQGKELAAHATFTVNAGIPVYFCDPHSPWQRGSNENTNGLLRQYFPKGTDLSGYTQPELDAVAARLNGRPRETLGWKTPQEKLDELLVNAGGATTG
jgi:transposase, IS30 family